MKFYPKFESTFNFNKAVFVVSFFTLISRLIGLLRDRLFASKFGASETLDIYFAAFRIPDFIFNLLILGTLSVAFIPVFTEKYLKNEKKAIEIANTILNFAVILMGSICVVVFLFALPITKILLPGFDPEKLEATAKLTKILLLSPVIFTISSVFGSILNSKKHFFVTSLAPVLYNFGIIFGLLFLYPKFSLNGIGFGVILGAFLHLLVQAIESYRLGFVWKPILNLKDESVKKIGKLFLPRIFGLDASQISLLVGSTIGSWLPAGSIAVLNLANNLQAVPLGVFALATSVASFPALSENFAKKNESAFIETLSEGIVKILFFILPISIFMLIYRAYIVRLALGSGKFDWTDTIATFTTLGVFSFSLFSQSLTPLFAKAFYARHNTKTPVVIGLICMCINILLSVWLATSQHTFAFSFGFFKFSFTFFGTVGIAAGFSLASLLNCLLLFIFLRKNIFKNLPTVHSQNFDDYLFANIFKMIIAGCFSGFTAYLSLATFGPLVDTKTGLGILIQSFVSGSFAILVYLLFGKILRLKTAQEVLNFFNKKVGIT